MLTKRQIITIGAGFAATSLVPKLELIASSNSAPTEFKKKRSITFEQALKDVSVRENYFVELLEEMYGDRVNKYFSRIIYDDDKSKAKEYAHNHVDKENLENVMKKLEPAVVGILYFKINIGKKLKHEIYVFGKIFEPVPLQYNPTKKITVNQTEKKIKAKLSHEFLHGEDYHEGIRLESGVLINYTNYDSIDTDVLDFIIETRGYIRQVETARDLMISAMDVKNLILSMQLEKVPPEYLTEFLDLGKNISSSNNLLKYAINLNATKYDQKYSLSQLYLVNQLNQLKKIFPEIMVFQEVRDFYKGFGIQ